MGKIFAKRITARHPNIGGDPRQGGCVDRHLRDIRPADPVDDGHGQKRRTAGQFIARPGQIGITNGHQLDQLLEHFIHITGQFLDQCNAVTWFILSYNQPVAVINFAPLGGQKTHVNPVFLGHQLILIGLFNLQITHPPAKKPGKSKLGAADQQTAPVDPAPIMFDLILKPFHARSPTAASSSPNATRRTFKTTCVNSTATG